MPRPTRNVCRVLRGGLPRLAGLVMGAVVVASPATAQRIENGVAVFAALDKVTAKISRLEVKLNDTATFGALKVTPRVCYSRPPTEMPKTSTFIEVDEIQLDGKQNRVFSGWMFAESPALNPLEHPVFDIWLTECTAPLRPGVAEKGPQPRPKGQPGTAQPGATPSGTGAGPAWPSATTQPEAPPEDFRRRRPR